MNEKVINSALKFIELKLSQLGEQITAAIPPPSEDTGMEESVNKQTAMLVSVVARIENVIKTIKAPTFSGKIDVNTSKMEKVLSKIDTDIKKIKVPTTKATEQSLKTIITELKTTNTKTTIKEFASIVSAIELLKNEIQKKEYPTTFKLDEMQLRAIKPQPVSVGGFGGRLPARAIIITNVAMATADTEYSHVFSKNCVSFRIKLRSQNASFNYAWETGKLKVSGDASAYISIPANFLDSRGDIEYNGKKIFFESGTASQVLEVEEGIS